MESSVVIIHIVKSGKRREMTVEFSKLIYDLCLEIDPEKDPNEFGLLLPSPDPKQCLWLENSQRFGLYSLRQRTELEYREKMRRVRVQTLDETKKIVMVDDSKIVAHLMVTICSKMGISNHEEYGLIRQMGEEDRLLNMTLKRNKVTAAGATLPRDYEKLEKMKQKLQTDDDLSWLAQNATLRQQGVTEDEILLLKRRYFYSDKNVDARDPVQLNLLYVQLRDSILNGKHPITQEEAINLAGIQCVIDYGKYLAEKMKSIHLDLKNYLPKEYVKVKGIDKKISQEHQKMENISELDAKYRYIQLCRSLKTYGITFFLVKEKMKGKNKLVPRLFGVSRESVMRVDEKTKDIIQTWPLTTVKRYASRVNLFTLDFGEYSEQKYTMQTTDGEAISQLLSGYIDIIVKKRNKREHQEDMEEEFSAIHEESIGPGQANVITHHALAFTPQPIHHSNVALPGTFRAPSHATPDVISLVHDAPKHAAKMGAFSFGDASVPSVVPLRGAGGVVARGHVMPTQPQRSFQVHDLEQPKKALVVRIDNNIHLLDQLRNTVKEDAKDCDSSNLMRVSKRNTLDNIGLASHDIINSVAAVGLAVGEIVTLVLPEAADDENNLDCGKLNPPVAIIGANLKQLLDNIKLAKYLQENLENSPDREFGINTNNLMEATKLLADALQDFMKAATPQQLKNAEAESPGSPMSKTLWKNGILNAANTVADASHKLLKAVNVQRNEDCQSLGDDVVFRDLLLDKGKMVGAATFQLVDFTKQITRSLMQQPSQYASLISQPQSITNDLIAAAKLVGLSTSQLIAHTKVVALNLEQPRAQHLLISAAKQVDRCTETVLLAAKPLSSHDQLYEPLNQSSKRVNQAVAELMACVQQSTLQAQLDTTADQFVLAGERISDATSVPSEHEEKASTQQQLTGSGPSSLCRQAHTLVMAGNQLRIQLEKRSQQSDDVNLENIHEACKHVTQALSHLIKSNNATSPSNPQQLIDASRILQDSIHHCEPAQELLKSGIAHNLEINARVAASNTSQLAYLAQEATLHAVRMSNYKIATETQELTSTILPSVIVACNQVRQDPINVIYHQELLTASEELIGGLTEFLRSCESLCPMVTDAGMQAALQQITQQTHSQLTELQHAVHSSNILLRSLEPFSYSPSLSVQNDAQKVYEDWHTTEPGSYEQHILSLRRELVSNGTINSNVLEVIQNSPDKMEVTARNIIKCVQEGTELLPSVCRAIQDAPLSSPNPLSSRDDGLDERLRHWINETQPHFYAAMGQLALHHLVSGPQGFEKCMSTLNEGVAYHQCGERLIESLCNALSASSPEERSTCLLQLQQMSDGFIASAESCLESIPSYNVINTMMNTMISHKFLLDNVPITNGNPLEGGQKTNPQLVKRIGTVVDECQQSLACLTESVSSSDINRLSNTETALGQMKGKLDQLMALSNEAITSIPGCKLHLLKITDDMECLLHNLSLDGSMNSQGFSKDSIMKSIRELANSFDGLLKESLAGVAYRTQEATSRQAEHIIKKLELVYVNLQSIPNRPVNQNSYLQCCHHIDNVHSALVESLNKFESASIPDAESLLALQELVDDAISTSSQVRYLLAVGHADTEPGILQCHQDILQTREQFEILEKDSQRVLKSAKIAEVRDGLTSLLQHASQMCHTGKNLASKEYGTLAYKKKVIAHTTQLASKVSNLMQFCKSISSASSSMGDTEIGGVLQQMDVSGLMTTARQLIDVICLDPDSPSQKKIELSSSAVENQADVLGCLKEFLDSYQKFVIHAKETGGSKEPSMTPLTTVIEGNLKGLANEIRCKTPGHRECQLGLEMTSQCVNFVQEKALTSSSLPNMYSPDEQSRHLNMLSSVLRQLNQSVVPLEKAARDGRVEFLPHAISQCSDCLAPVVNNALACADGSGQRIQERNKILEQTRTVVEAYSEILSAVETLAFCNDHVDPEVGAKAQKELLQESLESVQTACSDLLSTCDRLAAKQGAITTLINSVASAFTKLEECSNGSSEKDIPSVVHFDVIQLLRQLSQAGQHLVMAESSSLDNVYVNINPQQSPAATFAQHAIGLAQCLGMVVQNLNEHRLSNHSRDKLMDATRVVGQCCTDLLRQPTSAQTLVEDLCNHACPYLLHQLQNCMQSMVAAPQACSDALAVVSDLQADLDTAVLFASSGAHMMDHRCSGSFYETGLWHLPTIPEEDEEDLSSEEEDENEEEMSPMKMENEEYHTPNTEHFNNVISRKADRFTLQVKNLCKSVMNQYKTGSSENIGESAKASVTLLRTLINTVNHGAAAQFSGKTANDIANGNFDIDGEDGMERQALQISLLHAVRDVTNSLQDVLSVAKNSTSIVNSNVSEQRPGSRNSKEVVLIENTFETLEKRVKHLVNNYRLVNDREHRGLAALESAVESMDSELASFCKWSPVDELEAQQGHIHKNSSSREHNNSESSANIVSSNGTNPVCRSEDLVRHIELIPQAISKAMVAMKTGKQDDILQASVAGRKAMLDLSLQLRGALIHFVREKCRVEEETSTSVDRISVVDIAEQYSDSWQPTLESGRNVLKYLFDIYSSLLQAIKEGKESSARTQMTLNSRRLSEAVAEMTEAARRLKGSDLVDSSDPSIIAEGELTEAADQIEAVAVKLAQLKPKRSLRVPSDKVVSSPLEESSVTVNLSESSCDETATTDIEFSRSNMDVEADLDDAMLSSAKDIVTATSLLVQAATKAQQELVAQGKWKQSSTTNDSVTFQWSQGLISAARMVAAATHNLSEAAYALFQHEPHASIERVISASKQVASSTAHLVVACTVKANKDSLAAKSLQEAGRSVRRATDALVRDARHAMQQDSLLSSNGKNYSSKRLENQGKDNDKLSVPESSDPAINPSMVSSMKKLIETEADIIAKERELEALRHHLNAMKKDHMKTKPDYFDT